MCAVLSSRQVTVDLLVAEGDLVTVKSSWRGRYSGTFRGAPFTDKDVVIGYTNILRIVNGRIAENRVSVNQPALAAQLGMSVCPAGAAH